MNETESGAQRIETGGKYLCDSALTHAGHFSKQQMQQNAENQYGQCQQRCERNKEITVVHSPILPKVYKLIPSDTGNNVKCNDNERQHAAGDHKNATDVNFESLKSGNVVGP